MHHGDGESKEGDVQRQEHQQRHGHQCDDGRAFDAGQIATYVAEPRQTNRPVRRQFWWDRHGIPEAPISDASTMMLMPNNPSGIEGSSSLCMPLVASAIS